MSAAYDRIQDMRRSLSKENPFYLVMFTVVCLSPLLAYSLPENVPTAWPWAKSFAELMSRMIPAIERLTALSQFPEVTRLFMSLQWAIWGPVCIWLTFKFGQPTEKKTIDALRFMQARWWYVIFFPPIAAAGVWLFVFLQFLGAISRGTPFDQMVSWMSESRFWLVLLAVCLLL